MQPGHEAVAVVGLDDRDRLDQADVADRLGQLGDLVVAASQPLDGGDGRPSGLLAGRAGWTRPKRYRVVIQRDRQMLCA